MLGRTDTDYLDKENDYIYILHRFDYNSQNLISQTRKVNKQSLALDLDTINRTHLFARTDARVFSQQRIPTLGFTSGLHADYHTPNDKVEFIDFDGLTKRTRLVFLLTWYLANRD